MAHALAMKSRAFKAGGAAPRPAAARQSPVVHNAAKELVSVTERLAPSLLAAIVAFSGATAIDAVYAPVARADDEETMSPYQKRQSELEKRREILREAREKAAARASGVAEPAAAAPAAPAKPAAPSTDFSSQAARLKKEGLKAYEDAAKNRPAVPVTPEPQEVGRGNSAPLFGGFSFSKPAEAPAPAAPAAPAAPSSFSTPPDPWRNKPAAVTPAPAPAPVIPAPKPVVPVPVPTPAPVNKVEAPAPAPAAAKKVEPKQAAAADARKPAKRRRGGMPLWLAELLVLGGYVGLGLAATKYSKKSGEVLKVAGEKVVEAYSAAEKLISKPKTSA